MRENNAILRIPIEELMLCCVFSIIRIITILFYLTLTHPLKFKRGQGQVSAILLAIKFLKTIFKEFLTNSPGANLAYLALLDNFLWVPFLLGSP